jgi:N,N-dimethylformamidase
MSQEPRADSIPPHRAIRVPGLHAYTDRLSVEAGGEIAFHVSSTLPYDFSVRQLGPDVDDAAQDVVLHTQRGQQPAVQPVHPGSYIAVERALASEPLHEFSLECWLKPWDFGDLQTLVSQSDFPLQPGFALQVDAEGAPVFTCEKTTLMAPPLVSRRWVHLAATFFRGRMALFVDGEEAASGSGPMECIPAAAPLRVGAAGRLGVADDFLDADIAMPAIHARCLSAGDVRARWRDGAQRCPRPEALLACWPLKEQRGEVIEDAGPHGRTGRLVNHGTWMVPGPRFDPSRVPRFSNLPTYDPCADPQRGHALRLASDDLVDCRWTETHRVALPATARPGVYVGRFDFEQDGESITYEASFVVRRARGSAPAPFVVLCATNTWLAYSSSPFARNCPGPSLWPRQGKGLPNAHPLAPDYNLYTPHRKGQPNYFVGLRMPRPNASPRALYAPEGSGFSQWVRLERHLHTWLDGQGYAYNIVTDLDLDRDPSLLEPYRAVIINGHSEYWSAPAREGLEAYLRRGGNAIVLSGNTMYWRVSFDPAGLVMEQRKTITPLLDEEAPVGRHAAPGGAHGEQYHSQDGQRGGLWRFTGGSSSHVIGVETAGWGFAEAGDFGVYRVKRPEHFLFRRPLSVGLAEGATFGHGPGGSLPRAVGHEWDLTMPTLRRRTGKVPKDCLLPPDETGIVVLADGVRRVPGRLDAYLDFLERPTSALEDGLSAEMIYWERPQGGRVFNAGAVGASWVLHADPAFAALLGNVLAHFGIPVPDQVDCRCFRGPTTALVRDE